MSTSRTAIGVALLGCLLCGMANRGLAERAWQQPGEIQKPREIQVPGEIQSPRGSWQVPKGFQAVESSDHPCELRYIATSDALFAFASADLNVDGETALALVLAEIRRRVPLTIVVRGHTDAIGSASANLALSERRAQAVGDWLIKRLGQHTELQIDAAGETQPVAPNQTASGEDDPSGRARNRRVEIILPLPGC